MSFFNQPNASAHLAGTASSARVKKCASELADYKAAVEAATWFRMTHPPLSGNYDGAAPRNVVAEAVSSEISRRADALERAWQANEK